MTRSGSGTTASRTPAKIRRRQERTQRILDVAPRLFSERVEVIIAACVADGVFRRVDPSLASSAVLGQLTWTQDWYSASGPLTPEELADWLVESAVQGLAATPAVDLADDRRLVRVGPRQTETS